MNTKFRKFLSYLLVLTLICSNLSVPALAEEVSGPIVEPAVTASPEVKPVEPAPLSTLTLPAALRVIEEEAFAGSTSIGRVVIPEGAAVIESRAFADSSLAEIVLPSSITDIASDAFSGCGEFTVVAEEGTFAYDWAVEKGYIEENPATPAEYFETEVLDDSTLAITGYTGTDADVIIPGEIGGMKVTAIGAGAFKQNFIITSIAIPEGVTSIGSEAFFSCAVLSGITLPESITSIESHAFAYCSALKTINLPANITSIASCTFSYCNSLTEITIPKGVTSIGSLAFSSCSALETVNLPTTLTRIEGSAFHSCSSLTDIIIPEGVTSIGNSAFRECTSLTHIAIPEGITSIEPLTFYNCGNLTSVSLPSTLTSISGFAFHECMSLTSIDLPDSLTSIGEDAFSYCYALRSIAIPEGVTSIPDGAFAGCGALSSVSLPYSLTSIGRWAFEYCSSLSEITLSANISFIGEYAFANCANLTATAFYGTYAANWCASNGVPCNAIGAPTPEVTPVHTPEPTPEVIPFTYITLDDGTLAITGYTGTKSDIVIPSEIDGVAVTAISASAFSENEVITSVVVPDSVTSIGEAAFFCCRNLESVYLPDSITVLEAQTFGDCFKLTEIRLPANLTSIGLCCFSFCQALAEIDLPDTLTFIGEQAFAFTTSLTSIELPEGLTTIDTEAFYSSALESITIPSSVTTFGFDPFWECRSLRSVTIEEGVTSLSHYMFADCTALTEVNLPESLVSMEAAFEGCTSLTYIEIPKNVSQIAEGAFDRCPDLTVGVYSGSHAEVYCKAEGVPYTVLYDAAPASDFEYFVSDHGYIVITGYKGTASELVIPGEIDGMQVAHIEEFAFEGNTNLTKVVILPGVEIISKMAFHSCSNLTEVVLPDTITNLYGSVFGYCTSLTKLNIPAGVTDLGFEFVAGCTSLTKLTLPAGLTSLGETVFKGSGLTELVLPESLTEIDPTAFNGCPDLVLNVASGSYAHTFCEEKGLSYVTREPEGDAADFEYYVTEENTVVITGYDGPEDVMSVPATIDGMQVVGIENGAFMQRDFIKVILPEGLTHIYSEAFGGCAQLESITLPSTLRVIDPYSFYNCDSLTEMVIPEGVTYIGEEAFWSCDSLQRVVVPGSVELIHFYTFGRCSSLTDVTLGEGVREICSEAFYCCSALEQIDLPESLISIHSRAFSYCSSLTSLSISANVEELGINPFEGCSSLASVEIDEANPWYCSEDGLIFNKAKTTLICCLPTKTGDLTVPDSVTFIDDSAFAASRLTSITIPATVVQMSYDVFNDCAATIYVYPNSFAAEWCLENGQPFTYLYSEYGDFLYTIPAEGTAAITGYSGAGGMVVIPSQLDGLKVTAIAENAFSGNENITGVIIPEGVESIGDGAFANCANPMTISIPASVISIGSGVFTGGGGVSLTVPAGSYAQQWCIDSGIEYTQAGAERLRYELDENGNATITEYYGYDRVYAVPATLYGHPVTAVGDGAFMGRSNLTRLSFPASVISIGSNVFFDSYSLAAFEVAADNPAYSAHDGVLYNKDQTALIAYPYDKGASFTVPEGVTAIGERAFYDNTLLTEIILPDGLLTIADRAFRDTRIAALDIPDTVTYIGDYAFSSCYDLESLSLSDSLEYLGEGAFEYCESLTEVVLPDSLTTMGSNAFCECYDLSKVTLGSGLTEIPDYAFSCTQPSEIVIPEGITRIGDGAFESNSKLKSVSLPSTLTTLGAYAFSYTGITSIDLPASLVSINANAFCDCEDLTAINVDEANTAYKSVDGVLFTKDGARLLCCPGSKTGSYEIPAGVTEINNNAFEYCRQLESVVVPEGVTVIGDYTFANCQRLASVTLPGSVAEISESAFEDSSNVIIYAPEGSFANDWAIENGFVYEEGVLESDHPYANDTDETWTYTHDSDAYALAVTFSTKTNLEHAWDFLYITDSTGSTTEYTGSMLSGAMLYLPGNTFSLRLTSDESVQRFGFRITKVEALTQEEYEALALYNTSVLTDGTLQINGYTGSDTDLTIPSEIGGVAVTAIGPNAFTNGNLTSVVIPEGVTTIGQNAFASCSSLTGLTLPSTLTQLEAYAFAWCHGLTELVIPSSLTDVWAYTFYNCSNLSSLVVSEGVRVINSNAFAACHNLMNVSLPASLTYIDGGAFTNCGMFTLTAPEDSFAYEWGVNNGYIEEKAIIESDHPYPDFADQTWEYTHPEDAYALILTFSRDTHFEDNWDFLTVTDAEGNSKRYSGSSLSGRKIAVKGNSFSLNLTSDGGSNYYGFAVTRIRALTEEEYNNYGEFTYNTQGDGTLAITGYTGFRTDLEIPAEIDGVRVTAITSYAFDSSALTSVVIPEGVTRIGYGAFRYSYDLTSVSLPESLSTIEGEAFSQCSSLTSIGIPEGVTFIGYAAFRSCSGLTSVSLPESLTNIEGEAFSNCTSLTDISLPDGLTTLRYSVFAQCSNLQSIKLPANLTIIENYAFHNCTGLTSVVIPEGVTSIGYAAFADIYNLTNVSLPASLTFIDDWAFGGSNNALITAPEGSYAYDWALENNYLDIAVLESDHPYEGQKTLTWEYQAQKEGTCALVLTFARKTNFSSEDYLTIIDESGNETSYWNNALSDQKVALVGDSFSLRLNSINGGSFGFVITRIQELNEEEYRNYGGFNYYTNDGVTAVISGYTGLLTDLAIPSEIDGYPVTAIGRQAFHNNDLLQRVVIPEGVTRIENEAFWSCDNLTEVVLPSTLTEISNYAFHNCTGLTSVVIPEGVTSIGYAAFADIYNLTNVSLPASLTFIDDWAFGGSNNALITAPEGSYAYDWALEHNYVDIAVLESDHPYEGQKTLTWEYQAQKEGTCALVLTFARRTNFSSEDYLTIIDESDNETNYWNNILSGMKVALIGDSFSLRLNSINGGSFGFAITRIQELNEEEYRNYGGFNYYTQSDGTATISGYTGLLTDVAIPSEIDGYPVTAIGGQAFYDNDRLQRVVIPEGVTRIEYEAFYSCDNLTELVLPSTLTSIGYAAFQNCSRLARINLPEGLTEIEGYSFSWCYSLTEITIPSSLSVIDYNAFAGCQRLTELTIPEGVTSIEYYAFGECYTLETVNLPSSLTFIDDGAFSGYGSRFAIYAPESSYAWQWASDRDLLPDVPIIESEHPYAADGDQTWEYIHPEEAYALAVTFNYKTSLEYGRNYLIITDAAGNEARYTGSALAEQTITVMGNSFTVRVTGEASGSHYGFCIIGVEPLTAGELPFEGCFSTEPLSDGTLRITSYNGGSSTVVIPAQIDGVPVTEIGSHAFESRGLISVVIPEGITSIGYYAFSYNYSMQQAVLPSTLKTLDDYAFNQCDLAEINLSEGLTTIGNCAFGGNDRITSVHIPASVTRFGEAVFYNCYDLTSFTIAEGNTAIKVADDVLFTANGRTLLMYLPAKTDKEYTVPAGVIRIAGHAFAQNGNPSDSLTGITLPEGLKSIGGSAFCRNSRLESIDIPSSCTKIDGNAFEQCSSLKEIVIPEGVDRIEWATFSNCSSLETVVLPESLLFIDHAFPNCTALTSINLPENLYSINTEAFIGCPNMQATVVSGSYAEEWCMNHGVSYTSVPSSTPALIESAHPYAPNTNETWEYAAEDENAAALLVTFSGRTYFVNGDYLTITDGSGASRSYQWDNLRSKTICLPGNSFSLTLYSDGGEGEYEVDYGFKVTDIVPLTEEEFLNYGEFTYYTQDYGTILITGFTGFNPNLVIPAEIDGYPVTTIGTSAFYDKDHLESVIIPEGVTAIYGSAFQSCDNLTAVSLPSTLTEIDSYAFYWSYSLAEITLPSSLTHIGSNAFGGCSSLTEIVIPDSVTTMGNNAFSTCSNLASVSIGSGLTSISNSAFSSCGTLTEITIPEGVTSIEYYAFGGCYGLKTVNLPASLTFIDDNAFAGCTSDLSVNAPEGSYAYQWAERMNLLPEVAIIESAHPYAPNSDESWTHTADSEDVYAHLVTFSRKTYFSAGDWLTITDGSGNGRSYSYDGLRNQTLCLPGSSFTLTLYADEYYEDFGFMVTKIVPLTEEEFLNYGEFTYYTQSDETAVITGFTGFNPNLVIPAEIDGYPVRAINNEAFCNNSQLVSVVIPEGVTHIYSTAFASCGNLTSVELPSTLTYIGNHVFSSCVALSNVVLPENLTVIDSYAFQCCYGLTSIVIPGSVTSLSQHAFNICSNLESVVVSEGVTAIEDYAFNACYQLTSASLPASLSSIGDAAFDQCSQITVTAPEGTYAYSWAERMNLLPETPIIESAHPYAPSSEESWTHTADSEDVYAHLVTFSRRTYLSAGDWLTITDGSGASSSYQWGGLRSQTLCVPGNSFTLTLRADAEGEDFGFMVTKIVPLTEEEFLGYGEFTYDMTADDCTLTITGYTGFNPNLVIPAEIDGYPVTAIGYNAFCDKDQLESVVIPEGVTYIDAQAFYSCNNLTAVSLPSTLTSINSLAFYNCSALTEINIPEGVVGIRESAFESCYALTTVSLPSTLSTIRSNVFYNCPALTEIVIPEGVTSIESWAFSDCYSLRTVSLPASLTFIDDYAFGYYGSEFTIIAPEGTYAYNWASDRNLLRENAIIESSHPYASSENHTWEYFAENPDTYAIALTFSAKTYLEDGCDYLRITAADGTSTSYTGGELADRIIPVIGNSVVLNLTSDSSYEYFGFRITRIEELTEEQYNNYARFDTVALEDGTLSIVGYAGLHSDLSIPAEIDGQPVSTIGARAFADNQSLTSISIPDGVHTIESQAFQSCYNLTSVSLPGSLNAIGEYAFNGCCSLASLTLPDSLTVIGQYAFCDCDNLTEITVPGTVSTFGMGAFNSCDRLETATICEGVTSIGTDAFSFCQTLTRVNLPQAMEFIGASAFSRTALTSVTLPSGLGKIHGSMFSNCTSLTDVCIPEGPTSIDNYAFSSCPNLSAIEIPYGVTSIGTGAFENCTGLSDVVLPTTLTSIGERAFDQCSSLTAIELPDSLTEIQSSAFSSCTSLASITIPSGVEKLGSHALYNCTALTEAVLSDSLTMIEYGLFNNCTGLTAIDIPDTVTGIGDCAFMNCILLTEITLPGSIEWISTSAFESCSNLTSVTMEEGVSTIHSSAFASCSALETVNLPASLNTIYDDAFANCYHVIVTAPEDSYAFNWAAQQGLLPEESVLESTHPYASNSNETWSYTHEGDAYALLVTFSPRTAFESGCDQLTVFDANGYGHVYSEKTLAGKTIGLLGNTFSLELISDGSVEYFGFRITKVEALTEEEYRAYGEFTYETLDNGTLEITGYTGFVRDLEIPSEIDGIPVTRIRYRAFECTDLTSVVIPEGVTEIGTHAFNSCQSLTSVTLPDSLTMIDAYAFNFCTHLTEIDLPDGLTFLGGSSFKLCESLKSVEIPGGLTTMGDDVFRDCISLTSAYIPGTIAYLGCATFSGCTSLTDVTITEGLTVIDYETFQNCTSLTSITIPEGVTRIWPTAFSGCTSLTSATLPGSLTQIDHPNFDGPTVITAPEGSYAYEWALMNGNIPDAIVLESAHPYADGMNETWTYNHEDEAYALAVTFSSRTQFESGYDHLYVTDGNGNMSDYTGSDLQGRTILLMGSSFTLNLTTDGSVNDYGFSIVRIEALTEEEYQNYGA